MFTILVAFLMGIFLIFQIGFSLHERDITVLYLYNKLVINKQYYIAHKIIDGTLQIVLIDEKSQIEIIVNRVYEKKMSVLCESNNITYRYNRIFKKISVISGETVE